MRRHNHRPIRTPLPQMPHHISPRRIGVGKHQQRMNTKRPQKLNHPTSHPPKKRIPKNRCRKPSPSIPLRPRNNQRHRPSPPRNQ